MRKIDPVLHEKLETLVSSMGYEFVGGEVTSQNSQTVFRLYIDKHGTDGKKGVTLDDCQAVSHQLSAMLDVDYPVQGRYVLEVSSPGVDRPLFNLKHFQEQVGQRVKMKLHVPLQQRRAFTGLLERVDGEDIWFKPDDSEQTVVVPFSTVDKANVVSDVFAHKGKKK
jgi:ribosome maturation factor RimP